MAHDDDAVLIHHDRLAEAELADGGSDGVDGGVVDARVVDVRPNGGQRAQFDLHRASPLLSLAGLSFRTECPYLSSTRTAGDLTKNLGELKPPHGLFWH